MKRAMIFSLIIFLITGCAASFKEQRELSKPMVALAMGKINNNDIQGALLQLRKAKNANKEDPEVYYGFALAYWKSGKNESALENIDQCIALGDKLGLEHPGLISEAYNLKGTILTGMGSYDKAMKEFKNALKDELYTTPEYPYHNIASLYLLNKEYGKAQEAANRALEHNSHYAPAWELLGRLYIEQGRDLQAIEALMHAVLEYPGYVDAHFELGQAYIRQGEKDKAIEHLQEVIRLDPNGLFGSEAQQMLQSLSGASKKK